jgi:hypothetical protein
MSVPDKPANNRLGFAGRRSRHFYGTDYPTTDERSLNTAAFSGRIKNLAVMEHRERGFRRKSMSGPKFLALLAMALISVKFELPPGEK